MVVALVLSFHRECLFIRRRFGAKGLKWLRKHVPELINETDLTPMMKSVMSRESQARVLWLPAFTSLYWFILGVNLDKTTNGECAFYELQCRTLCESQTDRMPPMPP